MEIPDFSGSAKTFVEGFLEMYQQGVADGKASLQAENKRLKEAIKRGRELYQENEPQQMLLVWKQALSEGGRKGK